nr:hypothetical protein [Tanacetum cinerariifolium]
VVASVWLCRGEEGGGSRGDGDGVDGVEESVVKVVRRWWRWGEGRAWVGWCLPRLPAAVAGNLPERRWILKWWRRYGCAAERRAAAVGGDGDGVDGVEESVVKVVRRWRRWGEGRAWVGWCLPRLPAAVAGNLPERRWILKYDVECEVVVGGRPGWVAGCL